MKKGFFSFLICTILLPIILQAETPKYSDSIRVYQLGGVINVTDERMQSNIPSALTTISYNTVHRTDAASMNELAITMPSTFFQTNSRGEASLFVRGTGDRRTEIFWDGMLLNLPWDRRFDLQMVPSNLIGNMTLSNGSATILYGSNTMGGSLDISSTERANNGFGGNVQLIGGDGGMLDFAVTQDGRIDKFNYVANISYFKRDGILLDNTSYDQAQNDDLQMQSQNKNSYLRTNSDEERLNLYLRGEYDITKSTSIGISLLHTQGEKGVMPESNDDDPRCWRYPEYARSIMAINAKSQLTENQKLKAVVWYDLFNQVIDGYTDMSYSVLDSKTDDEVGTMGARLSYNLDIADNQWLTAAVSSYSTHCTETISSYTDGYKEDGVALDYAEILYDLGLEYRIKLADRLVLSAGGLFSGQKHPETGSYTELEGKSANDFGGVFGGKFFINKDFTVFANVSRKVSYPALRESYANDPKKFAPNPNLSPEHGILSEVGTKYASMNWTVQVAGFYNSYTDMIAKSKLKDDPEGRKYMRINLAEGYIAGAEAVFGCYIIPKLDIDGSVTYLYGRGQEGNDSEETYLDYVPEIMANLRLRYKLPFDISASVEMNYAGTQYDAGDKLDPSYMLNLRAGYLLPVKFSAIEVFVRCNNLLDTQRWQKLGLPAAGRTIILGMKANI